MVKSASAAFVLLLLGAHGVGDLSHRLADPLSMFRDGELASLGYVLFAALLLVYLVCQLEAGREWARFERPVRRCRTSRCG